MMKLHKQAKKLVVLFLVSLLAYGSIIAQELPNIIIIYADDLGYGDLSCYNDSCAYYTQN